MFVTPSKSPSDITNGADNFTGENIKVVKGRRDSRNDKKFNTQENFSNTTNTQEVTGKDTEQSMRD